MHDAVAAPTPQPLIAALQRQQDLVSRLEAIARRQRPLIDAGDSAGLLALLADRQQVTDELLGIQDDLARLAEAAGAADGAQRRRIGALVEDVTGRLGDVIRRDEEAREALSARRDRAGEALGALSAARRARQAYVNAATLTNRFADRKG